MFDLLQSTRKYRKKVSGFTLLEILLVIAIIGILVIPLLITYRTSRTSQALDASATKFANHLRNAHVYARDANGKKGWGIIRKDSKSYLMVSGEKDSWEIESNFLLESGIEFQTDFFVWYEIGTGETENEQTIVLQNVDVGQSKVVVLKTGVVEVERI